MAWCFDHPTVAAAGVCAQCTHGWCDRCARRAGMHKDVCPGCGVLLAMPPAGGADDVLARLVSKDSLVMAASFAVVNLLLDFLHGGGPVPGSGGLFKVIALGAFVGYYFNIVQHVGGGAAGMPGPAELMDDMMTMASRAVRGVGCVLVALAPVIIWLFAAHPSGDPSAHWPMLVLLVVAGQLYMPAVIIAVTLGDSGLNALWPPMWFRIVARAPGPYASFALLWLASVFVGGAIVAVLQQIAMAIPYLGAVIAGMLSCMFWFLQAILVGRFMRQNAEAFGLA